MTRIGSFLPAGALLLFCVSGLRAQAHMLRGDANHDMDLDVSDPVATLSYLFLGLSEPPCLDAADADDSGDLDVTDAILTINFLFLGGPPPAAPYPTFELDPTEDGLSCLEVVEIAGDLAVDQSWTRDKVHELVGQVFLEAPAILTIEEGTTVLGDSATRGVLVVQPGASIIAVGTETHPVVFTTDQPAGKRRRGDWGGLVILGRGEVNLPGNSGLVEGMSRPVTFGGGEVSDNSDYSGQLNHVRIEWGGGEIAPNSTNALSLCAVGSGTRLDHIMLRFSGDDGLELRGGAAWLKYLLVDSCADEMFACSLGWSGQGQFWVGRAGPDLGGNGFEAVNGGSEREPGSPRRAQPVISNVTLIGPNGTNVMTQQGVNILQGGACRLYNFVVQGFDVALDIDDEATCMENSSDQLFLKHSIFFQNGAIAPRQPEEGPGQDETRWSAPCANASQLLANDPTNIMATTSPTEDPFDLLAPSFRAVGPDPTTNPFDPPNINGWFLLAPYRGAIPADPLELDWTRAPWMSWQRE